MQNKKSVVLSDVENSNKKAVLTLQECENGLDGTLRLYNFSRELDGVLSLGLYANQKVFKAGLTQTGHMLYKFFVGLQQIPTVFSCAIVNFQNANPKPILYGSSEGNSENIYGEIISEIAQTNSFEQTQNVLDRHGVELEGKEKIEEEIDKQMCEQDCANCIYKKYFFDHSSEKQSKDEETKKSVETEPIFFERLRPQIEKLFEKNPCEENLQSIIPNSKWIKVEYEDDGDFYVFGLIYDENEEVKYVCYGVPAVFEEEPPKELSGFPTWLPLNAENKEGFGYWLTYQDAESGEAVKLVVDQ